MKTTSFRDAFMPWSALALGTTGFFLTHQIGSDSTFQDCRAGSPWIVIVAALLGLALVALGALGSWGIYAASAETPARRLVAVVGMLACALYAIGITLALLSSLIIPGCWG